MRFIVLSLYVCCLNGAFVSALASGDKDMAQSLSNGHQSEMIQRVQRSDSSNLNKLRKRRAGSGSDTYAYGGTQQCLNANGQYYSPSGTYTIVTVNDQPPFISQNGYSDPVGFDVNLMKDIAAAYGIKFIYKWMNFNQLISAVQSDPNTISISTETDTLAREKYVDFAQYFNSSSSFLVRSCYNYPINGLSDLCGKTVAVLNGTIQASDVQTQNAACGTHNQITLKFYPTFTDVVNAVKSDSADVAIFDTTVLVYTAEHSNGELKVVGEPYDFGPLGILCNKKSRGLCCAFANAINCFIGDGTYQKLLKEYSFSYKNNGICPSRVNLNGPTCSPAYTPSHGLCKANLH